MRMSLGKIGYVSLALFLAGCSASGNMPSITPTALLVSGTPVTRRQELQLYDERRTRDADRLTLEVRVESLSRVTSEEGHSGWILVFSTLLANAGPEPVVLRVPKHVGYSMLNELTVNVFVPSGGVFAPPVMEGQTHRPQADEFIILQGRKQFEISHSFELAPIDWNDDGELDSWPSGQYGLEVHYSNRYIGYELPLASTPSDQIHGDALEEWRLDNWMVMDVQAWVGTVDSSRATFELP